MFSDFLAITAIAIICTSVAMPFIVISMAQQFDRPKAKSPAPKGSLSVVKTDPTRRPDGGHRPPNCS